VHVYWVGVVYEQPPCHWIVIVDVTDKMNYYFAMYKIICYALSKSYFIDKPERDNHWSHTIIALKFIPHVAHNNTDTMV